MQKDEAASCQGSVLNLGSVAKTVDEVTQSKTDCLPVSQHAAVTNSSTFYDGLDYPSLSVAMKRDSLAPVQTSREGNKKYVQQVRFSGANLAAGRDAYCDELFYGERETFAEGVDVTARVLQGQDQMHRAKAVLTSGGCGLEGNIIEQNSNYFSVPMTDLQMAIVSSKTLRNGQVPNEKAAFVKDRKMEGVPKQSHESKPIRILQRPTSHTSAQSEKRSDDEEVKMFDALTLNPQKRGHHRKKTLSLNPEEREALENLIEEVIIGGFEEDIASSDETASENEDLNIHKAVNERKQGTKDLKDRGDIGIRYAEQIVPEKGTRLVSLRDASDGKRNHFQKDFMSKTVSKYGRKDQRKIRDNDHYNTKFKADHHPTVECGVQQNKATMLNSEKENTDDRVQGLNIYPAQLKVAIKHMDSLPPRFLRRLQSGQNRLDLILPRHSEMASDDRGEPTATESDKGKSKVMQLQETKKSIRNLLCDLDQYVDEGVTTPVMKESLANLPFSLNPRDQSMESGAFQSESFSGVLKQSSPSDRMKPLTYLNQQPFNPRLFSLSMDASGVLKVPFVGPLNAVDSACLDEKSGFLSKNVVYQCEEVEKLLKSGSDVSPVGAKTLYCNNTEKKDFVQRNVEQFPGNGDDFDLYRQPANASVNMKKSQFSVDAPEFVSAFVKTSGAVDAGPGFQPGLFNPLQPGNGLSQSGVQMPLYVASDAAGNARDTLTREILPGTTSSEGGLSRMKYLGMPGMSGPLASYQTVPFVPASTLTPSAYLDPAPASQMPSELFASPLPCPPPPHPPHAVVGMMHYPPYHFPPYVPGFGHPEFALDRSNYLVPAAAPNWMNEMQSANGLPVAAMGWCPPEQAPFVSCPLGQQISEKAPMLLCGPGPFMQDSNYATWNWQNTCGDFDVLYQRVSYLLSNGEFVFVIIIGGATSDSSAMTSQLQGITDDVVFLSASGSQLNIDDTPILNSETTSGVVAPYPGPENHDAMNLSNYLSAEMEFKLKQVFQGKQSLIILDNTYATQPWDFQNYISLAQGLGYQVEVVDLSENGRYSGSEAPGSFMFEAGYHSTLIYPPSAPNSEFVTGGYSVPLSAPQSLINDVS